MASPNEWEEEPADAHMNLLNTSLGLLAVIVLVLANGFFVATEFSLVSVRRTRIDQVAQHTGTADLDTPIAPLVRPAFFTPASKRIGELLHEMRDKHTRMTILMDEYGGLDGIVTMEDLIEEIVGELADEGEADTPEVQTVDAQTSIVEGQICVEDANEQLNLRLPLGDYETLAGFILTRLGRLPDPGDRVIEQGIRLTVLEMQGSRIKRIEITRV
jgi:CBS domain containing-hemolysin-like protein